MLHQPVLGEKQFQFKAAKGLCQTFLFGKEEEFSACLVYGSHILIKNKCLNYTHLKESHFVHLKT